MEDEELHNRAFEITQIYEEKLEKFDFKLFGNPKISEEEKLLKLLFYKDAGVVMFLEIQYLIDEDKEREGIIVVELSILGNREEDLDKMLEVSNEFHKTNNIYR